MASNINPSNIDTTYPVAGQDNDSQGFRDNFTNIKSNFEYAESEIDDLQAKGIFKSALTGTTLDNDMAGSIIKNAKTEAFRATRVALGSVSGSTNIDYSAGNWHTLTTSGNVTLAFTNLPSAGNQCFVNVTVTISNVSHTITLPSAVGTGASAKSVLGVAGISSNIITFKETGTYEFVFHTDDAGTTIFLHELTRPRNRFTNGVTITDGGITMTTGAVTLSGSEDLGASGAANLSLLTSYFTTAAAETSTLAAGTDGQIKVLAAADITSGNMVTTVTNAGWKASGTGDITFDEIGQTVTLLYTNSKWYVIGAGPGASNGLAALS